MDPLAQLKDIHPPEQISNFPIAYGWWVVALLLIFIIVLSTYQYLKHRRLTQAKRKGLSFIESQATSSEQLVASVKWLCMQYFPRQDVASLHGEQLHQFLLSKLPENKQQHFDSKLAEQLSLHYKVNNHSSHQQDNQEVSQIKTAVKFWVNNALPPKKLKDGEVL